MRGFQLALGFGNSGFCLVTSFRGLDKHKVWDVRGHDIAVRGLACQVRVVLRKQEHAFWFLG